LKYLSPGEYEEGRTFSKIYFDNSFLFSSTCKNRSFILLEHNICRTKSQSRRIVFCSRYRTHISHIGSNPDTNKVKCKWRIIEKQENGKTDRQWEQAEQMGTTKCYHGYCYHLANVIKLNQIYQSKITLLYLMYVPGSFA